MNYYDKYIKYKSKYIELSGGFKDLEINLSNIDSSSYSSETIKSINLEDSINPTKNQQSGGSRFKCIPDQDKYVNICVQDNTEGKYKSKEKCFNDCESKYIQSQLKKVKLYGESVQFYLFIKDLINQEHMSIYIKGGNVIGLAVLKLIYSRYKNDEVKFSTAFKQFLEMELIKDWDFTAYTHGKEITESYRLKLDKMASKYKLVPRAKTFVLYQTLKPLLIYDKALFEIAILDLDSNKYSKMEIPLTTMKVKVTEYNLKYIFMLAKSFYANTKYKVPFDLDIIKKIMSQIDIIIHPNKSGLYDPKHNIDHGDINCDLFEFINKFTNRSMYLDQFFVTQLEDPYRLIYRLPEKNLAKTSSIINFIHKELPGLNTPSWLLDVKYINKLTNQFIKELGQKLSQIYSQTNSIDKVLDFLTGANFGKPQIQIEWNDFNSDTKTRLLTIFGPVVKKIGIDNLKKIIESNGLDKIKNMSGLTNSNKILKLLGFLIEKKLFNK